MVFPTLMVVVVAVVVAIAATMPTPLRVVSSIDGW